MPRKPTEKAPAIKKLLNEMAGRDDAIKTNRCVRPPIGCGEVVEQFRDAISEKEYRITGLCQQCQDAISG